MEFDAKEWTEIIFAEIGCPHTEEYGHCEDGCPCCASMKSDIEKHVYSIFNAGKRAGRSEAGETEDGQQ